MLKPGDRVGEQLGDRHRYEVQSLLGAGAFGAVFRGYDHKLGRTVAIILAGLNHPNIIGILDIDEGHDAIVLEFAAGGTLEGILERQNRLPIHRALEIGISVLSALEVLHNELIWHRDLKPANILLDNNGTVKVSDFGIAHAPERGGLKLVHTMFGQPGTPVYMSPEQIEGKPLDGRSDLWAAGVILFQMLTGRLHLPFWTLEDAHPGEVYAKLREMITKTRPKPPSAVCSDLPALLDDIVMRALAPKPEERYESAKKMRTSLTRVLRRLPDPDDQSTGRDKRPQDHALASTSRRRSPKNLGPKARRARRRA